MARQPAFFDVEERLQRLSDIGDQLEACAAVANFEFFRSDLEAALGYSDGAKGGRAAHDPVLMFKLLVIQAQNGLSDDKAGFLINDRSFMRFLGLSDRVPDAKTIWMFRERPTRAGAIDGLFRRFDAAIRAAGYIAMSGQIVDSSLVAAPKQRNTRDEEQAVKAGKSAHEIWPGQPSKACQKDVGARWTIQTGKARPDPERKALLDIAIPTFGYKAHTSIDRRYRLIRCWEVTDASRQDGCLLPYRSIAVLAVHRHERRTRGCADPRSAACVCHQGARSRPDHDRQVAGSHAGATTARYAPPAGFGLESRG